MPRRKGGMNQRDNQKKGGMGGLEHGRDAYSAGKDGKGREQHLLMDLFGGMIWYSRPFLGTASPGGCCFLGLNRKKMPNSGPVST